MMDKQEKMRYISKHRGLDELVGKIRLWPSRNGVLHGIKNMECRGNTVIITTHGGETFTVWNSRSSRSARWIRNHWMKCPCKKCAIPEWKLEKYSKTKFV